MTVMMMRRCTKILKITFNIKEEIERKAKKKKKTKKQCVWTSLFNFQHKYTTEERMTNIANVAKEGLFVCIRDLLN
jgi:adenylyl- and sulfurtransferase ThiI